MEEILSTFNPWWEGHFESSSVSRVEYVDKLIKEKKERDIVFVTGLRRVGKTVIIHQVIERLLKTVKPTDILYVSLDHPAFISMSILDIVREHRKLHGLGRQRRLFLFLDEVHLKSGFERDLKVLYDMEKVKIYASGSSSLLLKHKGAFLTGRYMTVHVRPLDFREFMRFRDVKIKSSERYLYESELEEYMRMGGMPEYVLRKRNPQYLLELTEGVITKDIIARYGTKNPELLRKLLLLLAERVGKPMTFNKLSKILGLTPDTVKQYVGYLEETYLVRTIPKHARSLNERVYSPKKVYMTDVGIKTVLTGFKDKGALAENLVFLKLDRLGEVFYHHEGLREIDFISGKTAVEVKYKDVLDEQEMKVLTNSKFKEKILISKAPFSVKGVKNITLVDYLLGNK